MAQFFPNSTLADHEIRWSTTQSAIMAAQVWKAQLLGQVLVGLTLPTSPIQTGVLLPERLVWVRSGLETDLVDFACSGILGILYPNPRPDWHPEKSSELR